MGGGVVVGREEGRGGGNGVGWGTETTDEGGLVAGGPLANASSNREAEAAVLNGERKNQYSLFSSFICSAEVDTGQI